MRSLDDVKTLLDSKREQVVDARAAARFRGEAPEPRAGLRSGHMPGAFNLPYNDLLDPKTGTMLPAAEIKARIAASGIDPAEEGDRELRLGRHRLRGRRSASISPARRKRRSTTARGPNGADVPTRRSSPDLPNGRAVGRRHGRLDRHRLRLRQGPAASAFHVFGSVRKQADADRLSTEFGNSFAPLVFDVTDASAVAAGAKQVEAALGDATLFGLVNNAGMAVPGPLLHVKIADFEHQLSVNLTGQLIVTQAFAPLLGAGRVRQAGPDASS